VRQHKAQHLGTISMVQVRGGRQRTATIDGKDGLVLFG
jgi:hypothetical protein